MKKLLTLFLIISCQVSIGMLSAVEAQAQAPQAIPYQAVARDNSGNLIANQNISLRFSIHDSTAAGTVVYKETQSATTNALGLFTANIGTGTVVTGTFATINWGTNAKFIQVEMDATGGTTYTNMGTKQMQSVPYALNAANGNWTKTANDISNSNSGNVGIGISSPTAKLHVVGTVKIADGTQGTGRILASDAAGLASWQGSTNFRVYNSVSQNAGTSGIISWNSTDYSNNATFGSNAFTAITAGLYHFEVSLDYIFLTAPQLLTLQLAVNGIVKSLTFIPETNSGLEKTVTISDNLMLNVNDIVTVRASSNGNYVIQGSSSKSSFSGFKVN